MKAFSYLIKLIYTLLLLLPFFPKTLASNQTPFVGFCFQNHVSLHQVLSDLQTFMLKTDQVQFNNQKNCLEIGLSPGRQKLFKTYLKRKYIVLNTYTKNQQQGISTITSNQSSDQKICHFIVVKEKNLQSNDRNIVIGRRSSFLASEVRETSSTQSYLSVMANTPGKLSYKGLSLELRCIPQGQNHYKVHFSLTSIKKLREEGKVETKISDQLMTTRSLSLGQRVNIGGVVNDLRKKAKSLNIPKRFTYLKRKGYDQRNYWLKLRQMSH